MQQFANREVLAGLRHHPFIGGNHQRDEIDTADPGQHVFDKSLMSGNIDDAKVDIVIEEQRREAQFNGNTALLLFFQAIRVDPGQRLDQTGFTMVDMARCAKDDLFHRAGTRS